jgi:lipopolysaccharide export system ATP-binding protein
LDLLIHERAKLGITYLSQQRNVFNMSVFSNLMGIAQISIKGKQEQKEIVEKLLNEFNLQHLRSLNTSVLSGGEVRRLQIARTLINNPKVILLDEPMAALDPIVVQDIQKYILKLQAMKTGVIVTDHNIQNLLQIVDRLFVIGENTIITSGKKEDVLSHAKAKKLYFGFDS